ncbi:MAG: 3-deoxy-D-manno-octulosonic acid transferase [Gemmatimonadota bacterium]
MGTPAHGRPDPAAGGFVAGSRDHFLYNLLLVPAVVLAAPFWVPWALLSTRRRRNFPDRMGARLARIPPPAGRERVWVHAVSVGETLAAAPLVRLLRARRPEAEIFLSTVTLTGQETAAKTLGGASDGRFYFPFDLPWICGRFLDRVRPGAVVILETELWPNFIAACARRGIPVVVLNARISERSFRGYGRFGFLFAKVLRSVSAFSAQTADDARRLVALGADPASVAVAGNMKFDVAVPRDEASPLRTWLLGEKARGAAWFVAGSTHEGEDAEVLRAFRAAREISGSIRLLIAPRHPERFDAVADLCAREGLAAARRSRLDLDGSAPPAPVVLLDSVGELLAAYAAADVAFVGGSLVAKGGHNILEPALYGVPTIVGPHMENFREIAEIFTSGQAVRTVRSGAELAAELSRWASDPGPYAETGRKAAELLAAFRGATARNVAIVERELSRRRGTG